MPNLKVKNRSISSVRPLCGARASISSAVVIGVDTLHRAFHYRIGPNENEPTSAAAKNAKAAVVLITFIHSLLKAIIGCPDVEHKPR
jgi:hypothetical protein